MARRVQTYARHLLRPRHTLALLQKRPTSSTAAGVLATRKRIDVLDSHMSYLDTGDRGGTLDKAVIFLHGNPTQAYLWRNVMPQVEPVARCLAPDLIGMGHSGKIKSEYKFKDHFKYLSAWIDAMDLPKKLNFVIHDWGSGLGFHWCNLHRDRVQSITYMEALVGPMRSWDDFPEPSRKFFQALRSKHGEDMVLEKNLFVELLLPNAVLRGLTEQEMAEYISPFTEPGESRRPTLTWPREIPILSDGPEDVCQLSLAYHAWLRESRDIPKLYVHAEPGFFAPLIAKIVKDFPNNKSVTVKGHHFLQEDSPVEIGNAVRDFVKDL